MSAGTRTSEFRLCRLPARVDRLMLFVPIRCTEGTIFPRCPYPLYGRDGKLTLLSVEFSTTGVRLSESHSICQTTLHLCVAPVDTVGRLGPNPISVGSASLGHFQSLRHWSTNIRAVCAIRSLILLTCYRPLGTPTILYFVPA